MVLDKVKVNGAAATVYLFTDRLVVRTEDDEQEICVGEIARVATKGTVRTGTVTVGLADGGLLAIRGLRLRDARLAHRTLVRLAGGRDH